MLHGPSYRAGPDPDIQSLRARRRFGHHRGDQATKAPRRNSLTGLIFLAFLAVSALVFTRNMSLFGLWLGVKSVAVSTGCAVAEDLGRTKNGDQRMWADGKYRESGGCAHASD